MLDIKKHRKFRIISTLIDNKLDANELEVTFANYLINASPILREMIDDEPNCLKNYSQTIQDQFNIGESRAQIKVDESDEVIIDYDTIENLMAEYSAQANNLLGVCLQENSLSLETDIIRVDYTCRLFSRIFGLYLEEQNVPSRMKFNCIDGYNSCDVLEYVSFLTKTSINSW